jgi:peptide deformylase
MATLPIVTGQDTPVLLQKTESVTTFGKELRAVIADLTETMKHAAGVGLAAPQVGLSLSVCVAMIGRKTVALVNPEIVWESEELSVMEEGCLSLPDCWIEVERPLTIIVRYQDEKGRMQERKLTQFDARVVQHEIDHLNGILITQHPKRIEKDLVRIKGRLEA